MKSALGFIVIALYAVCNDAFADSSAVDITASFRYDSNINRTERDSGREGDAIWRLSAVASHRRELGDNHGFIARWGGTTDIHTEFGDLNVGRIHGSLTYLIQPVLGFNTPWIAVTGRVELAEFAASDIRDGHTASLGLELGQRLTDRINFRVGYTASDRDASKSQVFEQRQGHLHAIADYSVNNRLNGYVKYDFTHGDTVTGAPRNAKLRAAHRVRAPDRAFGRRNVAWRLYGERHDLRLGTKYTLAKRTALDIAVQHSLTYAEGDNQWNVWQAGMSIVHRFQ